MKKLYSVLATAGLAFILSGCGSNYVSTPSFDTLDEKKLCNLKVNGIENVLANAVMYNKIAKENGVEFKRLGMTNTQYIDETKKALASGTTTIVLLNGKKKTKNSVSVEYAAQRACKFAISALTQESEGKNTWRAAVPGDGFQY